MAKFLQASRVKETTSTTGTADLALGGASTGFQSFADGIGDGNLCPYFVADGSGNWERGIGTVVAGAPDTLQRTTVLESSNGGAKAVLAAGNKDVACGPDPDLMFAHARDVRTITAGETLTAKSSGVLLLADCSAGAFTQAAPAVAAVPKGFTFGVMKIDSTTNACTIDPNGSELANGAATVAIDRKYDAAWFINTGSAWVVAEEAGRPVLPGGDVLAAASRLAVNYSTASQVTITADELTLTDKSGRRRLFKSVSLTLDVSTTGANGREAAENSGNEKASDWYHIHAIAKEDGTIAAFASLARFPGGSAIHDGLPTDYVFAGYVGAAYNNGSSNLIEFRQRGRDVIIDAQSVLSGGTATSDTSVSLAAAVPDTARVARGRATINDSGSGQSLMNIKPITGSNVGAVAVVNAGGTTANSGSLWDLLLITAQTIYYSVTTSDSGSLTVSGFSY